LEQNLSKNEAKKENLKLIIGQKPKLAIIIDDMANKEQVKELKTLHLKLNPSFFPSHTLHPNTPKLAKEFEFYMVHLPLKALSFQNKMSVLSPEDSEEEIEKTIAKIKAEFKNLKFINNHTGSLFTSDEEAMRKLYKALDKYHLSFVDSKTIHHSKAPKIAKEMQKIYIKRDIFLDNEDDVNYVKNQLLNAVNLAQKRGYAIAIGHPKKNTFKALKESKELLKSVELVYLSELYE
ncbi:divergent polysaccharide deacetylase family protein, partial [Campylobacter upsaliensis]|nr:divergent polysaccharide deacetylase family protein [Campylobacter upsaliensis]